MMYAVITYTNMRGIRSIDRIVDLCERDIAFIWLTQGRKPKRDAFYEFKSKKLTSDILDDLNYQFMRRLQKEWRGSINCHLAGLLDSIGNLYANEGRSYVERAAKAYIQCTDSSREFMLFAIGRNINKYHRFLHVKLKKFEGKPQ